jgi:hypothetical protein
MTILEGLGSFNNRSHNADSFDRIFTNSRFVG